MKKVNLSFLVLAFAVASIVHAKSKPKSCKTYVTVQLATDDEQVWLFGKGLKKYSTICMADATHPPQYLIVDKAETLHGERHVWVPSSVSHTQVNADTSLSGDVSGDATTTGNATTVTKTRQTETYTHVHGHAYVFKIGADGKAEEYPVFATTKSAGFATQADVSSLEAALKFVSKQ